MTSSWQAPAELEAQSPPRQTRLTRLAFWSLILAFVVSLVFFVMGVAQVKNLVTAHHRYELLTQTGLNEMAHVSRTWAQREGKQTVYLVSYVYTVGDKRFEGRSHVAPNEFNSRVLGEALPIQYLQDHPHTSRLLIELAPPPYWASVINFIFPLLFTLTLVLPLQKQRVILANGVAAHGVITSLAKTRGGLTVRYDYTTDAGLVVKGKSLVPSKMELVEGQIVTILYLSDDPGKSIVYPPTLARLKS